MTTAIRGCDNKSIIHISIINQENPADSRVVAPKTYSEVYAWISQHRDKALSIQTGRGRCVIWDSDWKIKGKWDHETSEILLATVKKSPQDYKMTISDTGEISLSEV